MLFALLVTALSALWIWLRHVYSYWERKGLPFLKPSIPFGSLEAVRKKESSFGIAIYDIYKATKEPFIGIYLLFRPAILVRDASLVKRILAKDFNSFHDRGVYVDVEADPTSESLFSLTGARWKAMRSKLTPSFTSGKLKGMFPIIEAIGEKFSGHIAEIVSAREGSEEQSEAKIVEMKQFIDRYAIDVIASVIFGHEINSFKDPDNVFQELAKHFQRDNLITNIISFAAFLCPSVMKVVKRLPLEDKIANIMTDLVKRIIEFREENKTSRKDLMQLLIQLRNTGKINIDDSIWDVETANENLKSMSIEQIAGHVSLFYIAGFDTTAATSAYCLFEVARNEAIKERLLTEIEEVMEAHGNVLSYEAIQEMKYLDLCIMETVRKYPGLPILNRECTEDYNIPDTSYTIPQGTAIVISLIGLHRDPQHFPDPLQFKPERFLPENQDYNTDAYMPFGEGPRNCIAFRMGKISAKVAILSILRKFNVEPVDYKEIEFSKHGVTLLPRNGIRLKVSLK